VYVNLSTRIAAAAIGVSLMAAPLMAQAPAPPLTLDDAVAQAIANSRLVKVAALDVGKADDELTAIRTRRLPTFDVKSLDGTIVAPLDFRFGQGVFGVFPQIGPVPGIDTTIRTDPRFLSVLTIQIAQPLTQLRKVALGEKVLSVGRQIAEERVRREEQDAANNVKHLYYGIVQAQGGLQADAEALTLYREVDRLMGEYVRRDAVLQGDVLQVKTALARQEQTDLVLRNTIATLKEQLNVLLGRDISTDFSVAGEPAGAEPDVDIPSAQARAVAERPEIRDARLKVQQAEYDLRLKKEERIPEISAAFSYLGFYNFEVLPHHAAAVGIVGTWEPWDWGRKKAEADARARTVEQAKLAVLEAESRVMVDVSAHARKVQEARAMLSVADLARQAAAEKLRVALDQFKQEAAMRRQILEAQSADASARQQYQVALADFWSARADYDKALGER
jgi:outer membrane protein TolC